MWRILRDSLRSFCSSSVSSEPSSTIEPGERDDVEPDRDGVDLRVREREGRAVEGEVLGVAHGVATAQLAVELGEADAARAGDGLVAADVQADEPGEVVERLEHRHRGHRRAVGVGDDALGDVVEVLGVDLRHDERDVGVLAPGAGVVHDDRAGGGDARRPLAGRRPAVGEQGDVEAGEVGGRGVLDGDLLALPRQGGARGPSRGEVADLVDGEAPLVEKGAHDVADLPGRAEDSDSHGSSLESGPDAGRPAHDAGVTHGHGQAAASRSTRCRSSRDAVRGRLGGRVGCQPHPVSGGAWLR